MKKHKDKREKSPCTCDDDDADCEILSTKYQKRFEGFQRFSDFFLASLQSVCGGWETPFFWQHMVKVFSLCAFLLGKLCCVCWYNFQLHQ